MNFNSFTKSGFGIFFKIMLSPSTCEKSITSIQIPLPLTVSYKHKVIYMLKGLKSLTSHNVRPTKS